MKSRRMRWARNVACMGEERKCARFWWEILKERDHLEDRGIDGIRMDLRDIGLGCVEWIQLAQDRDW
jgi:alpha-glucosidase (family GH31 glycosyl hydrolase)